MKKLFNLIVNSKIYRSLIRGSSPETDRGKSELVMNNLLFHIHPVKVRRKALDFTYTFHLGFIALYLFIILCVTGILLMFYYRPITPQAFYDIKDLEFAVFLGKFLRRLHRWSAHGMVAVVIMHMCRVFYSAAYKEPRQFNWIIGVMLLLLTLGLSFTGYLLPWDQLAYWAITVGTSIASYAPIVGNKIKFLLLGGHTIGDAALIRFYVLHVMVLPVILSILIGIHFWRIRKDEGLACDIEEVENNIKKEGVLSSPDKEKTYGLMALVEEPQIGEVKNSSDEDELEFSFPYAFLRYLVSFIFTLAVLFIISYFFEAPLEEMANPNVTPNPAKAPWYFLGLQELVSKSAFLGGVVIPGLIVGALIALPYFDFNPSHKRKDRKFIISVFTLILIIFIILTIIGTFFRGPNWNWVLPWQHIPGGH